MPDRDQQERFRKAVARKAEQAEQASREGGAPSPRNDPSGVEPEIQHGLISHDQPQDTMSARDKSSGKGKKTADKWNQ